MAVNQTEHQSLQGLSESEVALIRQRSGRNIFQAERSRKFRHVLSDLVLEPMFTILLFASCLYFLLGKAGEGWMMLSGIIFISAISVYQDLRSTKAIAALQRFSEPRAIVIRDGVEKWVLTEDLVPGDIILLQEGGRVPADAVIISSNDLSIDESVVTGESMPVEKFPGHGTDKLYQSTLVNSGKCMARVTATGNNTILGKIGRSIGYYKPEKTTLQRQIERFVRKLALFGIIAFFVIWMLNYLNTGALIPSLLSGLTLAMASIPEEIPVAFTSFMALGAYQMSRYGILTRKPATVEGLGAVTVLCLDKTGTITENKMKVREIYDPRNNRIEEPNGALDTGSREVLLYALLASERDPFDAMEKAIVEAYVACAGHSAVPGYQMLHEYPLEGRPPMMTHAYTTGGTRIAAAKGAAERIIGVCHLPPETAASVLAVVNRMASKGFRVLGVAKAEQLSGSLPLRQDDLGWQFAGLVALYDPPKKNINEHILKLRKARIRIKMLTGDLPATALYIAGEAGMGNQTGCITGEQVMDMDEKQLREAVKTTDIFARMFPEAKLKVINAFKLNGEVVAMTGDGVNDAPAIQASNIGIAMGRNGTEIARQSSDLVLTDDDIGKMLIAIEYGRKIFNNLKKAFGYILSIHIPIILTASLPLLFGWQYPNIFSPIHVIFLELIMTPTCSIFFEREPIEANVMSQAPRAQSSPFFTRQEAIMSIIQGTVIAGSVLGLFYVYMNAGAPVERVRSVVFSTLLMANVFLTFTNRSFTETVLQTMRYRNSLAVPVVLISLLFIGIIQFAEPVAQVFEISRLRSNDLLLCFAVSFAAVSWFEVYKAIRRARH